MTAKPRKRRIMKQAEQATPAAAGQSEEKSFDLTPAGWAGRWSMELTAARESLKKWHDQGDKIIKRYLDERESTNHSDTRWNLFAANVQTKMAMLYGKPPSVDVTRRFSDPTDDVARVAGEIYERLLNADIEREDDGFCQASMNALSDRLLPGGGSIRFRYVRETEKVPGQKPMLDDAGAELAPEVPETEKVTFEDIETDYVPWKDQLWNQARVHSEVRWWAYRSHMTRQGLVERWGEELGNKIPLNGKRSADDPEGNKDPWGRAEVWEIWSKEHKKVFWYVEGYPVVLEMKDDPLKLEGFWPGPRPFFANLTTSKFVPRPDFVLAQDLYEEIDKVSTRIERIQRAIKVAGLYPKESAAVKQLLSEATQNTLLPVEDWAAFVKQGGMQGSVDWLPLEQLVKAMLALRDYRRELIDALYQIEGMSDIMRGQATQAAATATEQSIKAKYGGVRMQALQDEFARFVSDAQRIRAEMISKLFSPETIIERSNARFMGEDEQLVTQAVELIRSQFSAYRIEVKPEAISFTDFSQLKQERMEVLQAIGAYIQVIGPLAQQMPTAAPFFLEMLQVSLAGLRGGSAYEGIVDRAVTSAQQQAQQPQAAAPPDPKVQAQAMKGQQDMQKVQAETQARLMELGAEVQADAQREANQRKENVQEAMEKQLIQNALKPPDPPAAAKGPRR